jgi:hypothetical protein
MSEEKKAEESCCKDEKSCNCKSGCCGCKAAIAVILFLLGAVIGYLKGTSKCRSGCGMSMGMMGHMTPPIAPQPAGK